MIPESIILVSVSIWLGGMIDFGYSVPKRLQAKQDTTASVFDYAPHLTAFLVLVAIVANTAMIFPYLQDAESGEFTLSYLTDVNWILVAVFTVIGIAASVILIVLAKKNQNKPKD
jgi:hypothetical protein